MWNEEMHLEVTALEHRQGLFASWRAWCWHDVRTFFLDPGRLFVLVHHRRMKCAKYRWKISTMSILKPCGIS
jgi:hypothetical protein